MHDAPAVHHPLDRVARGGEVVGHALVGDEHGPARRQPRAEGRQRLRRPRHVVQRLQHDDEIEGPVRGHRLRALLLEADAEPVGGGAAARLGDRGRVEVVADDRGARVGARQRQRGPADAAAHVGHARGRIGLQAPVQVGHRRQPGAGEVLPEGRPVDAALAGDEGRAVGLVRHAPAGAVGVDDLLERAADAGHHLGERRHVGGVIGIDEDAHVLGRQPVAALGGGPGGVVHRHEPGHRLLLEPLPRVALGDARRGRELRDRQRAPGVERGVEAQALAQVDAEQLHRLDRRLEEAIGERLLRERRCASRHQRAGIFQRYTRCVRRTCTSCDCSGFQSPMSKSCETTGVPGLRSRISVGCRRRFSSGSR